MNESTLSAMAAIIELNFNLAELLVIIVIISSILKVEGRNDFLIVIEWIVYQMLKPITFFWRKRPETQVDPALFVLLAILIPAQLISVAYFRGII